MSTLTAQTVNAATAVKTAALQDASGGNSMAPADINQGRAKVWATVTNAGSTALVDGFGVASLTDAGAGNTTVTFSVAMSNALYCYATSPGASPQVTGAVVTKGTGSCQTLYRNNSGFGDTDQDFGLLIFGDR
jgi:H+/gluconate symporter-like permease